MCSRKREKSAGEDEREEMTRNVLLNRKSCRAVNLSVVRGDVTYPPRDTGEADRITCSGDAIMKVTVWKVVRGILSVKDCSKKTLSACMKELNMKSLCELRTITEKGLSDGGEYSLLCFILKISHFVEGEYPVDKAVCICKEICSNGKLGSCFKTIIHNQFSQELHSCLYLNTLSTGDIITFVNPAVFLNPSFKADLNQPYVVETGLKETERIVVYKLDNGLLRQAKDCVVKWLETNLPFSSAADPQEKKMRQSCSQMPTNIEDSVEPRCEPYVILMSLKKPTKTMIDSSVLNLLSGYCSQSCHQMCYFEAIQWNEKKIALCPRCWSPVDMNFCLLFRALLVHCQRLVNIVLTGKEADSFLEVRVHDFLNDQGKRDLALKSLESKYVYGSEYRAYKLKLSEVSKWY